VPDFGLFTIFLWDPFPKDGLLPVEIVIVATSYPTKFMHNVFGPISRYHDIMPDAVFILTDLNFTEFCV